MTVRIRRAEPADVDFLLELATHEDVEPYMSVRRPRDRESLLEEIERSAGEPNLGGLAIHPDFRGRRLADDAARLLQRHLLFELGYHRLQLECYGFNDRAIRHAERVGFVREGVKRKAYWRHGAWIDGIIFGILKEDLEQVEPASR